MEPERAMEIMDIILKDRVAKAGDQRQQEVARENLKGISERTGISLAELEEFINEITNLAAILKSYTQEAGRRLINEN